MFWKHKKVLVTGAGGFIGSHLVEELTKRSAKVKAFVRYNSRNDWGNLELLPKKIYKNIEIITGDVRDPFFVQKAVNGCDIVFHLSALIAIPYSYIAPRDFIDTNVVGTLNVMHACLEEGTDKVIHTSTSEVYGTAIYNPIDEKHPLQSQSPYSASKIGADKIAESFYNSYNLPVTTIRPFNTFGPRQSARAVIPTICSQILAGKEKIDLGMLKPIRDFNYIKDTVDGFIKIAESNKSIGEVINVGSGRGISINHLLKLIINLIGNDKEVNVKSDQARIRPEKSEVMVLVCNNSKAKKLIGWEPRYSLEEGLKETIKYIENNRKYYKSDIYNI